MPGNYVFVPIEGNFKEDISLATAADRYCVFSLGDQMAQTSFCEQGKKRPHWNDIINFETKDDNDVCYVEVRERLPGKLDEKVGVAEINLKEAEKNGKVTKWFNVKNCDEIAGQILVEIDTTYTEHDPHLSLHLGTKVHGDELSKFFSF